MHWRQFSETNPIAALSNDPVHVTFNGAHVADRVWNEDDRKWVIEAIGGDPDIFEMVNAAWEAEVERKDQQYKDRRDEEDRQRRMKSAIAQNTARAAMGLDLSPNEKRSAHV